MIVVLGRVSERMWGGGRQRARMYFFNYLLQYSDSQLYDWESHNACCVLSDMDGSRCSTFPYLLSSFTVLLAYAFFIHLHTDILTMLVRCSDCSLSWTKKWCLYCLLAWMNLVTNLPSVQWLSINVNGDYSTASDYLLLINRSWDKNNLW